MCSHAAQAARQEDVFKSIQESVGERTEFDSRPVILLALGGAGVLVALAILGRRQHKAAAPKTLNHAGKLTREVLRDVPINPAEMRQLKTLADSLAPETGGEAPDPLTLLLCPSLLIRGVKAAPPKLDRKAIAQVVRKLQLNKPTEKP